MYNNKQSFFLTLVVFLREFEKNENVITDLMIIMKIFGGQSLSRFYVDGAAGYVEEKYSNF